MKKTILAIALLTTVSILPTPQAFAADKTTKYRVYQNDQLLMEFSDYAKATRYASQFTHARVEDIGTHAWLWNNYPRYRLYQGDITLDNWQFTKLDDAIREARNWGYASIRDLQSDGWVWDNYPNYRLYQGDLTLDGWEFQTLDDAIAEARKWGNAHIINLHTHEWIWDNLSAARKKELRSGPAIYQVKQGTYAPDSWKFAYLEDAIRESLHWGGSVIVDTSNANKVVFSNEQLYQVYQNDILLDRYLDIDQAIAYAKRWSHATVRRDGHVLWTNTPAYSVYQRENRIGEFSTIPDALAFGTYYANASIRNETGQQIWNNYRKLTYWGWNGSSGLETIKSQLSQTQGLDVDSPSWFSLADANGTLKDTSAKEAADTLNKLGVAVHPLVTNQFDPALTSSFLASETAQNKFVQALVSRCAQLGVNGINVDFESVNGKDRKAFTGFLQKLTDAAHASGLTVSIDLPRGSVKWNHLGAFDHEAIGGIVDYVMIMAYDQYYAGSSAPGSVAGLQWVEEGIQEFLSYGIPRDKVMLGIPFYVREWTLDAAGSLTGNRALYTKDLDALLAGKPTETKWDDTFKQFKIEYPDGGGKKVLWLENADTLKARLELAKKYELAGVAMWRLGQEPQGFWDVLIKSK